MLIVMKPDATAQDIERVNDEIRRRGWQPHAIPGATRTAIGITGNKGAVEPEPFRVLPGVADAVPVSQPYKLRQPRGEARGHRRSTSAASRSAAATICVMAGPCSVETREQILAPAAAVKTRGRHACCAAAPSSPAPAPTSSRA